MHLVAFMVSSFGRISMFPMVVLVIESFFFKRADFQVLHKDPRTLLVRVETEFVHFALLVGYAPQSGLPIAERCAWWDALQHIASLKAQDEQLFVFLDANADPGPCDDKHVLTTGFKQTANTEFLAYVPVCS